MASSNELDPHDDLAGLDLSALDLDHIELSEVEPPAPWSMYAQLILLLLLVALLLWFPQSSYYYLWGDAGFFALSLGAVVVGISLGRWFLRWAEQAAARYAARRKPADPHSPPKPASPLRRWLTLAAGLAGAVGVVVLVPAQAYYQDGQESQLIWFIAASGAVVSGILLSRWLLLQADSGVKRAPLRMPKLPPWFRWVTLGILVIVGVAAMVIGYINDQRGSSEQIEFALGGVGFVVGICAAIWLARHFDDTEAKLKRRYQQQQAARLPTVRSPPSRTPRT